MSENNITSEKNYELYKLEIISTNGRGINIYPQLVELSIFEDIYNSTISGEVMISDSLDFFASIPLNGFEFISIGFSKPGSEGDVIFEGVYRIYKMKSLAVSPVTTSNHTYILYFCSEENILSLSRRISKSYKAKTSSEIVSDILANQLRVSSKKLARTSIEKTIGRYDIILPYLNPLAAISWIASRTISSTAKSAGACYMFYENSLGYNFKSLETLFQQESKAKYLYRAKNISFPRETFTDQVRNVITYQFMNTFDIISGMSQGMFSSLLRGVDLTRLQVNSVTFDYDEFFKKSTHINNDRISTDKTPHPFHNDYSDRLGNKIYKNYFSTMKMYPTNKNHDTNFNIARKQPAINQNLVESWMLQRASQISQLNYFKLKLVVPGDTLIRVGDIIDFTVPLGTGDNLEIENKNPYYSGRYLITAIRHKMNYESYEMIIEATRDCLSTGLPRELSGNPLVDEIKKR